MRQGSKPEGPRRASLPSARLGAKHEISLPGATLCVAQGARRAKARDAELLSWRQHMLAFDNEPLSQAIAEVSQQTGWPFERADPDLGNARVGGYVAGDPEAFIRLQARASILKLAAKARDARKASSHVTRAENARRRCALARAQSRSYQVSASADALRAHPAADPLRGGVGVCHTSVECFGAAHLAHARPRWRTSRRRWKRIRRHDCCERPIQRRRRYRIVRPRMKRPWRTMHVGVGPQQRSTRPQRQSLPIIEVTLRAPDDAVRFRSQP
jgi:hypothetical protein